MTELLTLLDRIEADGVHAVTGDELRRLVVTGHALRRKGSRSAEEAKLLHRIEDVLGWCNGEPPDEVVALASLEEASEEYREAVAAGTRPNQERWRRSVDQARARMHYLRFHYDQLRPDLAERYVSGRIPPVPPRVLALVARRMNEDERGYVKPGDFYESWARR